MRTDLRSRGSSLRRLAIRLAPAALAAAVHSASAQARPQSFWVDLEVTRLIARACPADYRAMFGTRPPEELDEPIAIMRERETLVTMRVTTHGDRKAAEAAMEAYRVNLAHQVEDGVAANGCNGFLIGLGFKQPGKIMTAPSREEILDSARLAEIPSTARPDDLPPEARIGTQAAYPLQQLLLQIFARPGSGRDCDPKTARVTPVSQKPFEAENQPPFVGTPTRYVETWTLQCRGKTQDIRVEFLQDARTWKHYDIQDIP